MEFDQSYVASVEGALDHEPNLLGRWRRLTDVASDTNRSAAELKPVAGWAIRLPPGVVACKGVTELWALLDGKFPASQPRIIVPALREDGSWPHIEDEGRLCLGKSFASADAGTRVLQHIADAIELLNYDAAKRKREFQSEVVTYWGRGDRATSAPGHWSLVTPGGPPRQVRRYYDSKRKLHIWADSKEQLIGWLRNAGFNPSEKEIEPAWAAWLPEAPTPLDFPTLGSEVLAHIPRDMQERLIRPGLKLPVLIGAPTEAGPTWVAAQLNIASERDLLRGFRPGRFPFSRAFNSMSTRPVDRLRVERIDGAYVHGRDQNKQYENLSKVRVALIGCGSLGSAVARLLAQAGSQSFILVDPDEMKAHNTSRHVVGNHGVGRPKAQALAAALEMDFPHQGPHKVIQSRAENLTREQLADLDKCDLIISAGIDLAGDHALTDWRLALPVPPPHVCTWVEPFAMAGHAIALFDKDDLRTIFDANEHPTIKMTDWRPEVVLEFREAGCGNTFQPHGAIDLQHTALTAATLCLDVLQLSVISSVRRTWQGDLAKVAALGGIARPEFDRSNTETIWPWVVPAAAEATP